MINAQPEINYNHRAVLPEFYDQFPVTAPVPAPPPKMLFSDLVKHWLRVKSVSVRPNTYDIYCVTAQKHIIPYFDARDLSVQKVTTLDLQDYFLAKTQEGIEASTLKKHYTIINGALSYAMYNLNFLYYNPAYAVIRPKVEPKSIDCYNEDELRELLIVSKGNEVLEAPIHISSNFGLRRSEALALRWDDIDIKNMKVDISHTICRVGSREFETDLTKTPKGIRVMPLSPELANYLKRLYALQKEDEAILGKKYVKNRLVCKKRNGTPIGLDYLSKYFSCFVKDHGLKEITFHDLRHSSASALINAGFDIFQICEWLGHADIRTTKRYLHLLFTTKAKMAEYMGKVLYNTKKNGRYYDEDFAAARFHLEVIEGGRDKARH